VLWQDIILERQILYIFIFIFIIRAYLTVRHKQPCRVRIYHQTKNTIVVKLVRGVSELSFLLWFTTIIAGKKFQPWIRLSSVTSELHDLYKGTVPH
jgi:hypothetical protein